jgi:hypothetical protein
MGTLEELALACTYRVARDDETNRLGFPEVGLGLFPAFGGSVRSIECIGPLPALRCMLEDADLLDAGIEFSTGFAPFRGGPMHYIHSGGLDKRHWLLEQREQRHDDQFHADADWANLRGV